MNYLKLFAASIALGCLSFIATAEECHYHIDFITKSIVRVRWSDNLEPSDNATGSCVYQPAKVKVKKHNHNGLTTYSTNELTLVAGKDAIIFINPSSGDTLAIDRGGECHSVARERVIYDDNTARGVETANGLVTVKQETRRDTVGMIKQFAVNFECPGEKALYGLGQHIEGYMNLLGKTLWLTQHNLKISIPVIVSPRGWGMMFDVGCAMAYSSSEQNFTINLDAAKCVDYYFIKGDGMDGVAQGYRFLTGAVEPLPRYAFGYIQSRERYTSSCDIISTLREYRRLGVPVDMIVQDWNYWPQGWGYMKMDRRHYPSPRALADSVHALNAKLMVSIWPNPQWCPQADDFAARGYMLQHSVYDVFNPDARRYYWSWANDEFFSAGFDAWWCDSSEPLDGDWNNPPAPNADGTPYNYENHERRWTLNKEILSESLGAERSSLYSLYHSRGIYENQRLTDSTKRVLTLTRSSYPGQQRYGTMVWNGDTYASWDAFRSQIPSGLNYMATGNPYWTTDVGGFFVKTGNQWFRRGEFVHGNKSDAFREYYTRMFQWATFLPMLRSHGTDTYREIWYFGEPGTPYYDAVKSMIELRYRLLPYIYSMALQQRFGCGTMARMLAYDFPNDTTVYDIADQYLFGDMMVCPVTRPLSETTTRRVYLPSGTKWIDWWTGAVLDGGQWISVQSPIDKFPLFVKGGSIVIESEVVQYSAEQLDKPLTIKLFDGGVGHFTLHEDAGDGYGYERGERSEIDFNWDANKKLLTIGSRRGSFPGMQTRREINVVFPDGTMRVVNYMGKTVRICS